MAQTSAIEWTDATWNPVTGCSKVSPGCANCYAETLTARFAGRPGYIEEHRPWTPENAEHNVRLHPERLEQPLRWRKPRMVFVNSMSDLFHEEIPDTFIAETFDVMRRASRHVFQVLTKRPERARDWHQSYGAAFQRFTATPYPLPNVWLGVSIENARHTWRADVLREVPAAVRFISAEPLLGSLFDGNRATKHEESDPDPMRERAPLDLTGIDWLIAGGESGGRDARPMHPQWARELRDACIHRACTAFFFKQWGSWAPVIGHLDAQTNLHALTPHGLEPLGPEHGSVTQWGELARTFYGHPIMRYAGAASKSGGRELDGRTWDEMPATQAVPA